LESLLSKKQRQAKPLPKWAELPYRGT